MDKSLNKNVFKILFCFVMFFSFTVGVSAKSIFEKDFSNTSSNVFEYCDGSNGCVPICVYAGKHDQYGLVGYHYDNPSLVPKPYGWVVSYTYFRARTMEDGGDDFGNNRYFDIFHAAMSEHLVKDNIFSSESDEEDFSKTQMYKNIENLFICPNYLYIDNGYNPGSDICFADGQNQCSKWNNKAGINFSSTSHEFKKVYSFESEYCNIATSTYKSLALKEDNGDDKSNLDKLHFLAKYDSGINPSDIDDSKGASENAVKLCQYFKDNASGVKYTSYLEKLSGGKDQFISEMDNSFKANANNSALRTLLPNGKYSDYNFYNYNTLYKIMVTDNSSSEKKFRNICLFQAGEQQTEAGMRNNSDDITTNQPIFKHLSSLYSLNVHTSVSYIASVCSENGVQIDVGTNFQEGLDEAKLQLDLYTYEDPKIDITNQVTYDCSFLTDVAGIIGDGYFILEMAGLAILVVLSVMDYLKVFLSDNADELKKANSRFIKRLIVAVLLFLLPALVNFSLRIFKIEGVNSEHPLCVQISNK